MVLSDSRKVAIIVTTGEQATLSEMIRVCGVAARSGASVRVFFRDESIPAIIRQDRSQPEVQAGAKSRLGSEDDPAQPPVDELLQTLAAAGDVRMYACSSSLYIWGVDASDLVSSIQGSRGLIAFLAEDLAGAAEALTF
jgi:peroxiredoxin family protein